MKPNKQKTQLPEIPDKRYFTIGEVGELCAVKPHVLRYWEQEFAALRPSKRKGSRRYYQRKDILLVRSIRELLYDKGFTISGARRQLKVIQKASQTELPLQMAVSQPEPAEVPNKLNSQRKFVQSVRKDLEKLLFELKD